MPSSHRRDSNKRDSWYITNKTGNILAIGDLPLVPTMNPGEKIDLLRYYGKQRIEHSTDLVSMVKSGMLSLKKKNDNTSERSVPANDVSNATSLAERDEVGSSGGGGSSNASDIIYSNITSGLTATDVQAALDEIDSTLDSHISNALQNIVEDTTPQLGGNLDAQDFNISSVSSITTEASATHALEIDRSAGDGVIASFWDSGLNNARLRMLGFSGGSNLQFRANVDESGNLDETSDVGLAFVLDARASEDAFQFYTTPSGAGVQSFTKIAKISGNDNFISGNLGLGVEDTPAIELDIRSQANDEAGIDITCNNGNFAYSRLKLINDVGDLVRVGLSSSTATFTNDAFDSGAGWFDTTGTSFNLISRGDNSDFNFFVGDTNNSDIALHIDSSGNVGIGTTDPEALLHVNGTALFEGNVTFGANSTLNVTGLDGGSSGITLEGAQVSMMTNLAMNGYWISNDGDSEGIFLDGSGNVGVGTNSPSEALEVAGDMIVDNRVLMPDNDNALAIVGGDSTANGAYFQVSGASRTQGNNRGALKFWANTSQSYVGGQDHAITFGHFDGASTWTERMFIDKDGNVGIGTVAPSRILDVQTTTDGVETINIANSSTGTGALAAFRMEANAGVGAFLVTGSNYTPSGILLGDQFVLQAEDTLSNGLLIRTGTNANADIVFAVNNTTEVLRIDQATGAFDFNDNAMTNVASIDGGGDPVVSLNEIQFGGATNAYPLIRGDQGSSTAKMFMEPEGGNNSITVSLAPAGTSTASSMRFSNASTASNTGMVLFGTDGSDAAMLSRVIGTPGTDITTMYIGQTNVTGLDTTGGSDLTEIHIALANANVATFTTAGLGIGTTDPDALLHVNGTALFEGDVTFGANSTLNVTGLDGGSSGIALEGAQVSMMTNLAMNGYWISNDGDNEGIFLEESGKVGIGTSTPGAGTNRDTLLHIVGDGTGTTGRTDFRVKNTSADSAATFSLENSDGNSLTVQVSGPSYAIGDAASIGTSTSTFGSNDAIDLIFSTNGNVATTGNNKIVFRPGGFDSSKEFVAFLPDGQVSIGKTTADANYLLDIEESADVWRRVKIENPNAGTAAQCGYQIRTDTGNALFAAYGSNYSTSTLAGNVLLTAAANKLVVGTSTLNDIEFYTGGISDTANRRVVIDSGGNVGIGTNTPASLLEIDSSSLSSGNAITVAGGTIETPAIPDNKNTIAIYGSDRAYFKGRDVTNDIEFVMGTSVLGVAFVGSMTNHGLDVRTNNTNAIQIDTSQNCTFTGTTLSLTGTDAVIEANAAGTVAVKADSSDGNASFTAIAGANSDSNLNLQGDRNWLIQNDGNATLGAADYLHIRDSTAGVVRLTIDTSGNVGINSTSPTATLEAYSTNVLSDLSQDAVFQVGLKSGGNIAFDPNEIQCRNNGAANDLFLQKNGGSVGIGTSNPQALLHVNGSFLFEGNMTVGSNANILMSGGSIDGGSSGITLEGAQVSMLTNLAMNGYWISNDGDSEGIFIDGEGKIGIGTSSPDVLLHCVGTGVSGRFQRDNTDTANQLSGIDILNADTTSNNGVAFTLASEDAAGSTYAGAKVGAKFTSHATNAPTTEIIFSTTDGSLTPAARMTVLAPGGVEFTERSSDPSDPSEGSFALWMSDGTASGDDGDIMVKITAGGVTKTATLVDFSTV